MKKLILSLISVFIMVFLFVPTNGVYAETYKEGKVNSSIGIKIRNCPNTQCGEISDGLANGRTVIILDEVASDSSKGVDGCDSKIWYKIIYTDSSTGNGYACSSFIIDIKEVEYDYSEDFEEQLAKFPISYQDQLRTLHALHPNWKFVALETYDSFTNILSGQYTSAGRSLIQDTSKTRDGLKSIDSWSYNFYTNVFSTSFSGGGSNWYAASKNTISYYLDPRNFLTEPYVFMFLSSGYQNNFNYTTDAINNLLKNTFMYNAMTNDGVHTFAEAFLDAGKTYGVDPYFLVARMLQELGVSNLKNRASNSFINGTHATYPGVYNYFNINATGGDVVANALSKAKSEGWTTDYKAILGGASFMANGYINDGQGSLYLQKFNVAKTNGGNYWHQYMQNIEAPRSEASSLYNSYSKYDLLDEELVFVIPVFSGMNSSNYILPNSGNPNHYLKTLTIDGATVTKFDGATLTYNVNISSIIDKVSISGTKVASTSTVTGFGDYTLNEGKTEIKVTVTAQNGNAQTYTLNITKDSTNPASVSSIISVAKYKSNDTYLFGLSENYDINSLITKITDIEYRAEVAVVDKDGKNKTSGVLVTGDKVTITSGDDKRTYTVVIYGDINGDGKVNSADLLKVKQHLLGTSLSGAYKETADVNKDGKINSADLLLIRQHLLGTNKISQ